MNIEYQTRFEAIENQRREICERIEGLTEANRAWKRAAADWSGLQIVEHLVLSDETVGSPDWARRKIAALPKAPGVHPQRFQLILWAMRRDLRLPLPSPEFEPRGETGWPALQTRWETARALLSEFLGSPDFDSASRPFLHTVAGALTAQQLLEMSQVHTAYHARQLHRLLQSQPPRDGSR